MRTLLLSIALCMACALAMAPRRALAMHPGSSPDASQLAARSAAADLTRRLLEAVAEARDGRTTRRELKRLAGERLRALATLMERDPAGMLEVALPEDVRRALPRAIRGRVETDAEVEGELEVLHVDHPTDSRFLFFVRTPRERLAVYLAGEPPAGAMTGSRVRARGKRIGRALALDGAASGLQVLAAALPNTLGGQRTAVILVNFQDKQTEPYSVADARAVVFTSTSNFDLEGSYQQTWLEGDVYGWYTIPLSSTVCDYSTLASQARTAATNAGVSLSGFTRLIYAFPGNACGWWGLGSVGGNPSAAWINGSFQLTVVAHEMGHNLGLYHSHALECGSTTLATSCSSIEYGDSVDVMGAAASGHFNAYQKERLGWLGTGASPPITTVQSSATYTIEPYESAGSAPKALKILKSTDASGRRTFFYVEARRGIGFDGGFAGNANLMNGVVVHTGSEASADSSYLLDMTPETSSWSDPALVVSRSFSDPGSGVTITPRSVGSAGATVDVVLGPIPCVRNAPTVTVSPNRQLAAPSTSVGYGVTVVNNDGSGCSTSTLALSPTVPAGWGSSLAGSSLTLAPGASGTTSLAVTVPATAAAGDHALSVSALGQGSGSVSGSGSGVCAVATALGVSLFTDRTSYARNQSVWVTVTVSANGAAQPGAAVTVTLTKPGGATASQTATTGTSGAATLKFRLRRQDPVGAYAVAASARSGALSGSAQTTFTVR